MKKNLLTIALFALVSTVTINCSKKSNDAVNCTDLANKTDAADLTYSTSPTTANCLAYKTAINNFINCPLITAQDKATLQLALSQLTCP